MKKRIISILCSLILILALFLFPSASPVEATSSLTDQVIWMFLVQATGSAAGYHTSYSGAEHGGSGGTFPDFYSDMFTQWQASYGGDAMILSEWIDGNVALSGEGTNVQFTVLEGGGSDIISGSAIDAMGILIGQVLVDKLSEFWDWFNVNVLGATDGTAVDGAHAGVGGNFGASSSFQQLSLVSSFLVYGSQSYSLVGTDGPVSGGFFAVTSSGNNNRCYIYAVADGPASVVGPNGSFALTLNSNTGLYYKDAVLQNYLKTDISGLPYYSSLEAGFTTYTDNFRRYLDSLSSYDLNEQTVTVGYKPGIETIEFPDPDDEETPENIPYIFPQEWPESLPEPDPDTGAVPAEDAIPWIIDGIIDGDGDVSYDDPENEPDPDTPSPSRPITSPGLADVFPFCLPFDIYRFFQALSADPVAPHFEWTMNIPGLVNYTFVIDLSQFNTVAQILRTLELLAFCVGLAFVTRAMLIRG